MELFEGAFEAVLWLAVFVSFLSLVCGLVSYFFASKLKHEWARNIVARHLHEAPMPFLCMMLFVGLVLLYHYNHFLGLMIVGAEIVFRGHVIVLAKNWWLEGYGREG